MSGRIRQARNNPDQGFTLIEVLVVMILIGVLAAIAIPVFLSQRAKAVDASEKSDAHTIATTMETYYTDTEAYPTSVTSTAAPDGTDVLTIGPDKVALSPGNSATISAKGSSAAVATAYCIVVSNPKASQTSWVWESDHGGLQPLGTKSCATGYGNTVL